MVIHSLFLYFSFYFSVECHRVSCYLLFLFAARRFKGCGVWHFDPMGKVSSFGKEMSCFGITHLVNNYISLHFGRSC